MRPIYSAPALLVLPLLVVAACDGGQPEATIDLETRSGAASTRGFAIESNLDAIFPLGDICVLHTLRENPAPGENPWAALVVSFDNDEPPYCQQLTPFLSGDDRLLEWDLSDATPITDLDVLQNLSETYDQASGRNVDYYTLTGPLTEWLWGATYDNGGTGTFTGLGDVCVVFVETDAGDTIGLVETQDVSAECPDIGPFIAGEHTVQIRAQDTAPLGNPTAEQEITAALYGAGAVVDYRVVNAPLQLLYGTMLGDTVDGVTFTDEQARSALELVNEASFEFLDDVVPLHVWAATSIVNNRPIANLSDLAAQWWVGPSALTRLRDFECPSGTVFEDGDCVDSGLLPFGADCLAEGGQGCESGLCTTTWDGYFCYYTSCTATCETHEDCEEQAIAAGLAPQDVQGNMWCSTTGVCSTQLLLGGESCE